MTSEDLEHMNEAVKQATASKSEDSRPHPRVGVVIIAIDGRTESAHRGGIDPGDHAA